ncbi:MAG: DUF3106 domain-containing protein [Burkholderiales bacterium]|nr:DUF3106 domain-containing protein [Burkholderiales bacterium]MDE2161287.1 DUF3106 domain-containing protein [Burkholderiales bacterium]MDE2501631.1 DUF3106 domain-containing protein [Burkholderiales bacterium]
MAALLVAAGAIAAPLARPAAPPPHVVAEAGPHWATLTPAQQQALAPLQRDWPSMVGWRKQKWLEVAARFPKMPAAERVRVQARMTEWARMTPAERTRARLQYQESRRLPADERQAKWKAYQALPDAERKTLAQRAKPLTKSAAAGSHRVAPGAVRHAAPVVTSRPVAPIVVQAKPGATTTTMTLHRPRPRTPVRVAGQPRIEATANFVDPVTLLPRRRIAVPVHRPAGPASGATAVPISNPASNAAPSLR